jgi:hypothetical protein
MSETAQTYTHNATTSSLLSGLQAGTLAHNTQTAGVVSGVTAGVYEHTAHIVDMQAQMALQGYLHAVRFRLSGGRANVPHQAALLYVLTRSDGAALPITYLHLMQLKGALLSLEAKLPGGAGSEWADIPQGETLKLAGRAVDLAGEVIATEDIFTAQLTDQQWTGSGFKIYATAAMPERVPHTVELDDIVYKNVTSSGRRSIRFPLKWGIQAGDTLTHPTIEPLVVSRFSATIDRRYRIMEATEDV